jgi:putative protein-disulfide isomerase
MPTTITYLFDPLCGWCYGASPAMQHLQQQADITLELLPTGLFSGTGARTMDAQFAQYAWSNDVRIQKLSGQVFSERYRAEVLEQAGGRFDSGPATLALGAVALTAPERELDALKAIHEARYVHGQDITQVPVLVAVLQGLGLPEAATRLAQSAQQVDAELLATAQTRMARAQALMRAHGAQGVPTVLVHAAQGERVLPSSALYGDFDALMTQIKVSKT